MKFSREMWLMVILKVTKIQSFTLSLEDIWKRYFFTFLEKRQRWGSYWPLPSLFMGQMNHITNWLMFTLFFAFAGHIIIKYSKTICNFSLYHTKLLSFLQVCKQQLLLLVAMILFAPIYFLLHNMPQTKSTQKLNISYAILKLTRFVPIT